MKISFKIVTRKTVVTAKDKAKFRFSPACASADRYRFRLRLSE